MSLTRKFILRFSKQQHQRHYSASTTNRRTMKSIVVSKFGGPEVLGVVEVPVPVPGPGQFLVKLHAAGVNPVDTYRRSGNYAALPPLPWVPGKDGAGTVAGLGQGVTKLKVDQRVWLSSSDTGTYAQYCLASEADAHPLPENFSFAQGASLWTAYATAYHGLFHIGEPQKTGGVILVHGASGGVGLAAVQFAKTIPGSLVIGTAGTEDGLKLIKESGADVVVNHREDGYTQKIMAATSGTGVDIILEMLANVNLNADVTMLAKRGRVCVIGNRGVVDGFNPRFLMQKRSSIRGVMLNEITKPEKEEIVEGINNALLRKQINPFISKQYPLTEAPQCHIDIINPPTGGQQGKLTINPWE